MTVDWSATDHELSGDDKPMFEEIVKTVLPNEAAAAGKKDPHDVASLR